MPTLVKLPNVFQINGSIPSLPSGTATVRNADTDAVVSIYSDRAGLSLLSSAGVTTATQGQLVGWSAPGVTWKITIAQQQGSQTVTYGPYFHEGNLGSVSADVSVFDARVDSVESGSPHLDRNPIIDMTTGRYNLSDGDDITAELTDAITRYAPVANQTGLVLYLPGDFELSGQIIFPAYIRPRGSGQRTATRIKCMTADAGFVVRSRGPMCGHFYIDANSIATQAFYTDAVDSSFEDIEVRNSAGNGIVVENAQNNVFRGMLVDGAALSSYIIKNGASANQFYMARATSFNRYAVEVMQEVAQGTAYPNGLSGTILAQSPILNKFFAPMIERLGTTLGGGTVGVGLGGVYHRGGSTAFYRPNFSIVPTTADTPTINLEWDGVATANKIFLEDPQALGDLTHGIFIQGLSDAFSSRAYVRANNGGEIQAYRAAYKLSDVSGVIAETSSGFYNNVTNRLENVGAGTKTYDQLVRSSRQEPIDYLRPAATDQILTTKRVADSGYRAGITADGILYQGDASSSTLTTYPGLFVGAGSPEGTVTARIGSIYRQTDAATTGSALWTKQTGTGTTGWVPTAATSITTIATDANATIASTTIAEQTFHTGTLTADRTLTFNAATASGQRRTITRSGTGAFNLIISNRGVGTVKALATGQWADMVWNGTDWVLQRFGSL